jgi:LCP family protein required for cell wall assembly
LRVVGLILVIAFATGLGAFAAATFLVQHEVNKLFKPTDKATIEAQKQLDAPLPGKPANVLIIGSDQREGAADNDRRSDTIMLVRLDPQKHTVSMLSFPRDLYVTIPGHGQSKINDAYSYGGPKLVVETIKELTGQDIHFIATVDFKGFKKIVDRVGGVYVSVDRKYFNENTGGSSNYAAIDLEPGYQLLDGKNALAFARFRHTDSDFYRMVRQQMFMTALKKQISRQSKTSMAKQAAGLFNIMEEDTDMAAGGNGTISSRTVIDYLRLALSLKGNNIFQVHVEGGLDMTAAGASIVTVDEAKMKAAVDAFTHPDKNAQEESVDQATGQRSVGDDANIPSSAANLTVTILNGNGEDGSANAAASQVENLGYKISIGGNADNFNYANSRVQYRRDADREVAESIAQSFDDATVEKVPANNTAKGRMFVIVGKGFAASSGSTTSTTSTLPVEVDDSQKVPQRGKPNVIVDPQYGWDELSELRGQTKVPLMYPTARETSSKYEFPVYNYTAHNYDSYRLVAKTGAGDYWGLQATLWPNPPILDEPTRSVKKGGRSYDLYFVGTHLHMVAWSQSGGTYWVENTLMNKLSNETMLAIAEGVKPLPRSVPAAR